MTYILWLFGISFALALGAFRLHGYLAGPDGRPGAASMAAYVFGWLCMLTALIAGIFLLTVLISG